jgi:chromosome partitioning protein
MTDSRTSISPKVFCIANQKGGVGKTTTAINLAASLCAQGRRVLLIDLDPQGNATMGSGIDKSSQEFNLYHVLIGEASLDSTSIKSPEGGYDVLPSNRELAGAEIDLIGMQDRERILEKAIQASAQKYDYVLIDCPPTLSLLTLNGLAAANGVIIPMQCEYFALEGLSDLVNTIKRVHRNINPKLNLIGLLRVMFDARVTLQQQVSTQLESHFKDKVFTAVIPRNVRLAEAPSYGIPGVIYDKSSRGAKAYIEFGAELIKRVEN